MTLLEAIASKKPFRQVGKEDYWIVHRGYAYPFKLEDLMAEYELEPKTVTITKDDVIRAIAAFEYDNRGNTATYFISRYLGLED